MRVQPVGQDQREFTEFYATAWDDCLRIVTLSVGNRQLAEDLVAEAFTKAWTSWRKIRGLDQPRAWIIRLGMSPGTVAAHLHRALAALRRTIPALNHQELTP